jgi:small subunit ribosomal protein S15Ae
MPFRVCSRAHARVQIENWVNILLPARSFGYIILTTSAGISAPPSSAFAATPLITRTVDHEEARRKHVAGKVLGYVF